MSGWVQLVEIVAFDNILLKGGRLAAVLSHLSDLHGKLAGLWFVEELFGSSPRKLRHTFTSPDELAAWLDANGT